MKVRKRPFDIKQYQPAKNHRNITMKETADMLRCSVLTLRRRIAERKLKGVVYIDPFKNGRLIFERESVERFLAVRAQATNKEYDASVYLDRR